MNPFIYPAVDFARTMMQPAVMGMLLQSGMLRTAWNPLATTPLGDYMQAGVELFDLLAKQHGKPEWDITHVVHKGQKVAVEQKIALHKPFADLLHFRPQTRAKQGLGKVLVIAPMSGHYPTLLRDTVETLLRDHEVYVTDWRDARLVPLAEGNFDLQTFIDYVIDFLRFVGDTAHAIAVCQPGPALLAAAAVLADDPKPVRPLSLTLIGSPIDVRLSPTLPNQIARKHDLGWFEENMVHRVPFSYEGAGRRVYPGFLQLFSFVQMNVPMHLNAQYTYFTNLTRGAEEKAEKHRKFYQEYLSVCDLHADFYLQTIEEIFQKCSLPRGLFVYRGRNVDLESIRSALYTIEGEYDDISGIGQTQAAHRLCKGIPEARKCIYIQKGAGHYGVFSGSKWRNAIYPNLRDFFAAQEQYA